MQTWIKDKEKLIESTDDLGNDLAGMIGLQRRLSGLSRDLAVIQAKVCFTIKMLIFIRFVQTFELSYILYYLLECMTTFLN